MNSFTQPGSPILISTELTEFDQYYFLERRFSIKLWNAQMSGMYILKAFSFNFIK